MYENGTGVEQDFAAAAEWYRKAAGNGHVPAECRLAELCCSGTGVPQDYSRAAEL